MGPGMYAGLRLEQDDKVLVPYIGYKGVNNAARPPGFCHYSFSGPRSEQKSRTGSRELFRKKRVDICQCLPPDKA